MSGLHDEAYLDDKLGLRNEETDGQLVDGLLDQCHALLKTATLLQGQDIV